MPFQSIKADPLASADDLDSPFLDQEEFEVGDEEVEIEVEEEEEEEASEDGEEKEIDEMEEQEVEEEEVEEVEEEEEDDDGVSEGGVAEESEEDGVDHVLEKQDVVEDGEDIEGEDNMVQGDEEVEEDTIGDDVDQEIEKEEEVVEEEEGGDKGEDEAVSSAEAANAVAEDANVQSGVLDKDQNSLFIPAGAWNAEMHHAHDSSKMLSTTSADNGSSAVISEHNLSVENGISEASLDKTREGSQLEKEINKEDSKHVKNNNCFETSEGSDNSGLPQSLKNDLSVDFCGRIESEIVKHDVLEKVELHLQQKNDSLLEDSTLIRGHTPRRRPRSASPCSEPDKNNKRPANICVFYARGWCIKGKSCKFLHQKDEINITEQKVKEDTGHSRILDSMAITGADEIVGGSIVSSALLDSDHKGSLGCNNLRQRALVRTYGSGTLVPSQLQGDHYDKHTEGEFQQTDHFRGGYTQTQEKYGKPFGKRHFESIVEKQSEDGFFSRRHLIEGKHVNEIHREDSPYDITNSGRTRVVETVCDSKLLSGTSSISPFLQQTRNIPSAYGRPEGNAVGGAQSLFLNQESYDSHSFSGSLNSGFGGSFQLPNFDYRLSRAGSPPTFGSARKNEYLEGQSLLDPDRRSSGSGSFSFTRDYSSYHLRSELRDMMHHNIPSDLPSMKTGKIHYNDWEPSRPFRSSLATGTTKSISSPSSQYDPILDSIEPVSTNAIDCFQASQMTSFQNSSFWPLKTDYALSSEGTLAKNVPLLDAHTSADVFLTSIKLQRGSNSLPNITKGLNPVRLAENSKNKDGELGGEWKGLEKGKNNKESKAFKIFHTALVDFVKDLLKPWWKDGQLSKDAHKTIVKKSVEKVLSALQSHQIPSTQEAINQYLASSRPKILKLVEGYVQKHANS